MSKEFKVGDKVRFSDCALDGLTDRTQLFIKNNKDNIFTVENVDDDSIFFDEYREGKEGLKFKRFVLAKDEQKEIIDNPKKKVSTRPAEEEDKPETKKEENTMESLKQLGALLQNHAVEAGKNAAAATVNDKLVAVLNKHTGGKLNVLKHVPFLGDMRYILSLVVVLLATTLVPASQYTIKAKKVALRAFDGKAYEKARELSETATEFLASVAKIDIPELD